MNTLFAFGFKKDATSSSPKSGSPKSSSSKSPRSNAKKGSSQTDALKRPESPNQFGKQSAEADVIGRRANGVTGSKRARLSTPSSSKKPTSKYADNPAIPADCKKKRIEVYWPKDKRWYPGTVLSNKNSIGKYLIFYDDETEETIDLNKERFRWLEKPEPEGNETPSKKKVQCKNGRLVKRLRRVVESSDEEEEFKLSEDENQSDSEYEQDDKNESDDDDEVMSLVSSDDESVKLQKKKTVRAAKTTPKKSPKTPSASFTTPRPVKTAARKNFTTPTPSKQRSPASAPPTKASSYSTPVRSATPIVGGFGSSPWTPASSRGTPRGAVTHSAGGRVGALPYGDHEHHYLRWLNEDLRDAARNKYGSDAYDPTSLHVPPGYLEGKPDFHATNSSKSRKITPAMRIWWQFKARSFDCVLFFKVGKFYELYHMDADVGVQHLNLLYMKGDTAHCGFPEISYGKFSEKLVRLGYRVARVEQTETPAEMKIRTGKSSGCVSREICSILSPGTRTLSFRDGWGTLGETKVTRLQLLALCEGQLPGDQSPRPDDHSVVFGVTIVDPTTGRFRVGHFLDNSHRFNLRTLLAQERAAELVFVRNGLTENTMSAIQYEAPERSSTNPTLYTVLCPRGQFESLDSVSANVGDVLQRSDSDAYFPDVEKRPKVLSNLLGTGSFKDKVTLASLGYALSVLRRAHIDHELITFGNTREYVHPSMQNQSCVKEEPKNGSFEDSFEVAAHMVLDGQALANLEVLECANANAPVEGSLFGFLNKCVTNFGTRRLKGWVAAPLFTVSAILRRQQLVASFVSLLENARLNGQEDLTANFRTALRKVPDLERLLARIHALGLKRSKESHPDAGAVLYENDKYNKTKIGGLLSALQGLAMLQRAFKDFALRVNACNVPNKDMVLQSVLPLIEFGKGRMEDISEDLEFFSRLFDHAKAKRDGCILPSDGEWEPYDSARERIRELKEKLEELRREEQAKCGLGTIKFYHPKQGKDLFQLEVPASRMKTANAPSHWTLKSQSKQVKRYYTKPILKLVESLAGLQLELESTRSDFTRGVFEQFDFRCSKWSGIVDCAAECDAIISLALVSADSSEEAPMTRPTILAPPPSKQQRPADDRSVYFSVRDSRHPCVAALLEQQGGGTFIANDIVLGSPPSSQGSGEDVDMSSHPPAGECLLLTGPNMGGKSTLLRQTCILAIMAQIGCFVPASECTMTPVDRIFTRVGASDRIMSGHSTFFVELSETTSILKSATCNSLTILDELGRGTSTFDGTAIAYAVVKDLCRIGCRMLFATHYHSLVHEFEDVKNKQHISLGHMTCYADESHAAEAEAKPKAADTMVTFLYKLGEGASDKSYGLNVARLAKLPANVIERAHVKSEEFEESLNQSVVPAAVCSEVKSVLKGTEDSDSQYKKLMRVWERLSKLSVTE